MGRAAEGGEAVWRGGGLLLPRLEPPGRAEGKRWRTRLRRTSCKRAAKSGRTEAAGEGPAICEMTKLAALASGASLTRFAAC